MSFDVNSVRKDFPILSRKVKDGKALVYLDSAATSQKPLSVINAMSEFLSRYNANVHRGVYQLSQEATDHYESVRLKVCAFLGTKKIEEIIYTSGTTDAVNLVMNTWGRDNVAAGDAVVVTRMEHHSNFVPWQQLALDRGAEFRIVELTADYRLDLDAFRKALAGRPKLVAFTMMSNVLGTMNPVRELAALAKEAGAMVFVDAAQGAAHAPFTIADLGPVDFVAFSSHKVCGPSGVGILWGREDVLRKMRPYQFGGDMISRVHDDRSDWNELPYKFEAGTPAIEGVVGFGAALDYLMKLGRANVAAYEKELAAYALGRLKEMPGVQIIGPETVEGRGSVISFAVEGVHPHDVATFLDEEGIAIRAGHHCAHPLLSKLGVPATNRASLFFYNTKAEVDELCRALKKTQDYFKAPLKSKKLGVGHVV